MPELILEIAALDYVFPAPLRICAIGPTGGTIGRDERNTFVLPDRYQRVSRLHAEVTFVRGVPILSNRSATLVVNVGEQEVDPGESAIVQDEDVIEVGPYLLYAHVKDERPPTPAPNASPLRLERAPVTSAALRQAFVEGAQLQPDALNEGLTPEIAELIGAMLRHSVQGTMDLMAARTITQREIQLGTSLISEQSNNPLLYLPTADAALVQLLTGLLPGFMHGTRAMPDAFSDLIAHDAGVMAGMHAAFGHMLECLDPQQDAPALRDSPQPSMFVATSAEKARWWDTQTKRFTQVATVAEDSFHDAWGRVFVDAYAKASVHKRTVVRSNLRQSQTCPAAMNGASIHVPATPGGHDLALGSATERQSCLV